MAKTSTKRKFFYCLILYETLKHFEIMVLFKKDRISIQVGTFTFPTCDVKLKQLKI